MAHHHHHEAATTGKAFALGMALNIVFVVVEAIYGWLADSSALMADAGHNLSDVLSLGFAWGALWLSNRKPKGKYTYGLRRTTILVSLLNALLIFVAVIFIAFEAIEKIRDPSPVSGNTVMIVAAIGIVINGITALLFMKGQKRDINVRGAYLHMLADAGVSAGVVIAGLLIMTTGAWWIDPVVSFVIIVVILAATWRLFTESINLALDAVPKNIDLEEVREYLTSVPGVEGVHDLHVWAMSTTQNALTTHLIVPEENGDQLLEDIRQALYNRFGIAHTTIQIERSAEQAAFHQDCGC